MIRKHIVYMLEYPARLDYSLADCMEISFNANEWKANLCHRQIADWRICVYMQYTVDCPTVPPVVVHIELSNSSCVNYINMNARKLFERFAGQELFTLTCSACVFEFARASERPAWPTERVWATKPWTITVAIRFHWLSAECVMVVDHFMSGHIGPMQQHFCWRYIWIHSIV